MAESMKLRRPGSVRELVDGCVANDPGAWAGFWRAVGGAARGGVWKTLAYLGGEPSLADDLIQELFLHLRADDSSRLRRFRGTTEGELRAFVRVAASRMAFQRLRRWRNVRTRETNAARAAAGAAQAGPTPAQIDLAIRDLESSMSRTDRDRLRRLRDWEDAAVPHCPRAVRRLRDDLVRRYAGRVG